MNRWQANIQIVLMLLIGVVSAVASWCFWFHLYFCLLFALLLLVWLVCYSYRLHIRNVRMFRRMIEGIRYGDLTLNFSKEGKSPLEQQLVEEINQVMAKFRADVSEKEERYLYFETLLNTVDSGLLVVDSTGHILWMNYAGVHDLCGHRVHHLEELNVLNSEFSALFETIHPGEVKVIRIYKEEMMQDMAVTVTEYSTRGVDLRLVNLRNIRSVLEENEMEAWQKLVRVLTHEIMNSIAPIISLSETLVDRMSQPGMLEKNQDIIQQGMQTIHRRSKGLLNFVENYRKLTRLSSPVLASVRVGDLLNDMKCLAPASNVRYIYKVEDEDRMLVLDRSQMEQVLINLLKNATEACMEQPHPEVVIETTYQPEKRIFQLSVSDNGRGILPDVLDKIFIPFYTTKPSGSGIGLSLCKQIMALHGGSIQVRSEVGKGSCFTLVMLVS